MPLKTKKPNISLSLTLSIYANMETNPKICNYKYMKKRIIHGIRLFITEYHANLKLSVFFFFFVIKP